MTNSLKIIQELERSSHELEPSSAMYAVAVLPAATESLRVLDTAYQTVNAYSPETAAEVPGGGDAGFWRKMLLLASPLFLAFGWVDFFKSARRLAQAKERSFDLWLNAIARFALAAGTTLAMAFLLTGLAYVAPYILAAVLGLNALQGLYYTVNYLHLAVTDKEHRWHHLKEAGKQFLGIAINSLAMVLNLFIFQTAKLIADGIRDFASDLFSLFMHFQELMDLVNGPVMTSVSNIKGVALGWLAALTLSLVVSASRINGQSWRMLTGSARPDELTFEREALSDMKRIVQIIRDGQENIFKRLFFALTAPITLTLYATTSFLYATLVRPAAALTVGIPELLLRGLWLAAKALFYPASQPVAAATADAGTKRDTQPNDEHKRLPNQLSAKAPQNQGSRLPTLTRSASFPSHFKPAPSSRDAVNMADDNEPSKRVQYK